MINKPDISIVIPTYNRIDIVRKTINHVLRQKNKNFELIIVDQSNYEDEIPNFSDSRIKYYLVDPPSVTAAKNFAVQKAKSNIILFIDDDVEFDQNLITEHLKAHKKYPDVGAVGGRVLQKDFPIMDEVLHFDDMAVSRGVFTSPKSGFTNAFPGGNCSIKINAIKKVNGFDTRYYGNAFREESDLSMRMFKCGIKIYFCPTACLTHLAVPTGGSRTKTYINILDTAMFYRNEMFFTLRMADKLIDAIKYKKKEYCDIPDIALKKKRTRLFYRGILFAIFRLLFNKQTVSKEKNVNRD